jgi:hypothetical protein
LIDDSDALSRPWVVDEFGILVDAAQLRAVAVKLVEVFGMVWRSGYAHKIFRDKLGLAALTVEGIHQLVSMKEKERATMTDNLLPIHFQDQPEPEQLLYEIFALVEAAPLN